MAVQGSVSGRPRSALALLGTHPSSCNLLGCIPCFQHSAQATAEVLLRNKPMDIFGQRNSQHDDSEAIYPGPWGKWRLHPGSSKTWPADLPSPAWRRHLRTPRLHGGGCTQRESSRLPQVTAHFNPKCRPKPHLQRSGKPNGFTQHCSLLELSPRNSTCENTPKPFQDLKRIRDRSGLSIRTGRNGAELH